MNAGIIIVTVIVHLFYALNIRLLVSSVFKKNETGKKDVILVGLYTISSLISAFNNMPHIIGIMNVIVLYIILFLIVLGGKKTDKLKVFFLMMIYLIIDSMLSSICILSIGTLKNTMFTVKLTSMFFNIMVTLYLLIKRRMKSDKDSVLLILSNKELAIITVYMLLLGLFNALAASDVFSEKIYMSMIKTMIVVILISSILITYYLMTTILSKKYYESSAKLIGMQLEAQLNYYKNLNEVIKELKNFKHDYKNHLICIRSLVSSDRSDEVIGYLDYLAERSDGRYKLFNSGNYIADALLKEKSCIAAKKDCCINFKGAISDRISPYNICTILSNALDNSIEGCERCPEGMERSIDIDCSIVNCVQLIRISNPSVCQSIKGSSKADKHNHGMGLYSISRVLEEIDGQMTVCSLNPRFVLEIEYRLSDTIEANKEL